jgi:glycosyltransferase involved in cell wall biosynthesis
MLETLMEILADQVTGDVEILTEIDGGELKIGVKRNKLLERAGGDYVAFIDDDDTVSEEYVDRILEAVSTGPSCVGITGNYYLDGAYTGIFHHSIENKEWDCRSYCVYRRCPNHLNPVRRALSVQVGFPEINMAEDKDYSQRLLPLLKTEVMVRPPIYNYYKRTYQ